MRIFTTALLSVYTLAAQTGAPPMFEVASIKQSQPQPDGQMRIGGSIEHTAPLAPGSSGGPLLDADGRLVGLNTNRIGEGFYLALPADGALRERVVAFLGRLEKLGSAPTPADVRAAKDAVIALPAAEEADVGAEGGFEVPAQVAAVVGAVRAD